MGLFFERIETEDKIVIKYFPTIGLPLILLLLVAFSTPTLTEINMIFACLNPLIFVGGMLIYGRYLKNITDETTRARRENRTKVSGSRLSFSNPLTIEIKKK